MSQRVLMKAVRDWLRQAPATPIQNGGLVGGAAKTASSVDVMFDGQPPPGCGEAFVAVHEGDWSNQATYDEGREDFIGVEITVTRRTAFAPQDRAVIALCDAADALDQICDQVVAIVHGNYGIMNNANTTLGGSVNGFVRPLFFRNAGKSAPKGPDWFSASAEGHRVEVGVARTLSFGGAQRVQHIESQT